jgi:hypothetical protein
MPLEPPIQGRPEAEGARESPPERRGVAMKPDQSRQNSGSAALGGSIRSEDLTRTVGAPMLRGHVELVSSPVMPHDPAAQHRPVHDPEAAALGPSSPRWIPKPLQRAALGRAWTAESARSRWSTRDGTLRNGHSANGIRIASPRLTVLSRLTGSVSPPPQ